MDEQINISPRFRLTKVPCEGEAGDLMVLTPLKEGERDNSPQGLAQLWFCTKSQDTNEQIPAIWKRVQFDGFAECKIPVIAEPPQNAPPLRRG